MPQRPLRVAFCHPDLGIGGAERLIVDAACELSKRGHAVDVFTAHHNPKHCFEETLSGRFSIIVAGSWFPRHIVNRAQALCAYIRCLLAATWLAWISWSGRDYDVVIVDQVSVVVPLLHLLTSAKVLFYCHFPDLLLARPRSALHVAYRRPLDWAEQVSTGAADHIVVNSHFTRGIFADTFRQLHARGIEPGVLYPAVSIPTEAELAANERAVAGQLPPPLVDFMGDSRCFLSINRFERKKNLELAVRALHALNSQLPASGACKLIVAGGYDERLRESRRYMADLKELVSQLRLQGQVWLMLSFTTEQRGLLLAAATAVLYTPTEEHFGIVPLEAMAHSRPVVACNSGGPRESVQHGRAGFLCAPTPNDFAKAMMHMTDVGEAAKLGTQARQHVQDSFSRTKFGEAVEHLIIEMTQG